MAISGKFVIKKHTILLTFMVSSVTYAAAESAAKCEDHFGQIAQSSDETSEKISRWKEYSESCAGTGVYEYQLAKLHIANRDYSAAEKVLSTSDDFPPPYEQYAALAKGDVVLHQKDYGSAEARYRKVVDDYPDWSNGYSNLGFAQLALGKYQDAVANLEKSISIQPTATAYRDAALAYYRLNEYERAAAALNNAYSLNNNIVSDRDAMVVGVRSFAELGKFEVAKNLLAMLLQARPGMKEDDEFLKAGLFLRQKLIEAGQIVE